MQSEDHAAHAASHGVDDGGEVGAASLNEQIIDTAKDHGLRVTRSPEVNRRLALLWDPPVASNRGRPARLSIDTVVQAGLAVAAADGLDALTMRRVAKQIGVGAMSLYTYVPGRAELIDLMIDRAYAELSLPTPDMDFRPAFTQWARQHWNMYVHHPWLLHTNRSRSPLAPHVLDAEEAGLRCLICAGMDPLEVERTMHLITDALQGAVRAAITEASDGTATGMNSEQYWQSMSGFWEDYFDAERYPIMTQVWLAGGFETVEITVEQTVDRLLAVIDMTIERGRRGPSSP